LPALPIAAKSGLIGEKLGTLVKRFLRRFVAILVSLAMQLSMIALSVSGGLSLLSLIALTTSVLAQMPESGMPESGMPESGMPESGETSPRSTPFWSEATRLLQSQSDLLDRAKTAITTPDPIENQTTSTKLLVQLRSLDLFLVRYGQNPRSRCVTASPSALKKATQLGRAAAGMDTAQRETYCQIYQLSRELTPLRDLLTQRASLFNPSRSRTVALFFTQSQAAPFSATTVEQVNLASPIPTPSPIAPLVYPKLLGGQRMKLSDTAIRPPAPAIAPPLDLLKLIDQGQVRIQIAQRNLPATTSSNDLPEADTTTPVTSFLPEAMDEATPDRPQPSPTRTPRERFAVPAAEAQLYAEFLKQDNTGIARVYPESAFVTPTNRLAPAIVPTPFGLRIQDGQFVLTGAVLDYGFIADLGDAELGKSLENSLGKSLENSLGKQSQLSLPDLFQTYQPPTTLADVQYHQRRFVAGKDTAFSSQAPATLNRTYAMRLVQYQLPDMVASGRPLKPGERGQLKSLLQAEGRDRIIAFRPVTRRLDGSYTVLWQVLKTNPEPVLTDLDRYVNLNLKTRSRN
jgi:hypothetical protein